MKKQDSIMEMFNLPSYIKGKTFAEASMAINDRFKDQKDPDSMATLKELQERLQQAQEFVKKQNQPDQATAQEGAQEGAHDDSYPETNEMLFGGKAEGSKGVGAAGYMSALTGAADLANMAFGKTGIDTSGATDIGDQHTSKGGSAVSGAMKGVQAGSALGAPGMVIGGGLGAIAGFLGGSNMQEEEIKARIANTGSKHKQSTNSYDAGGHAHPHPVKKNKYGELKSLSEMLESGFNTDPGRAGATIAKVATSPQQRSFPTGAEQLASSGERGIDALQSQVDAKNRKIDLTGTESAKFNPGELLRYAPAVANAYQLATLDKPEHEAYDRLSNTYDPQYVDEKSLQNVVSRDVAGMRDKIISTSGGSAGAASANLLASQLQGTKALSGAYIQAEDINRGENKAKQQFGLEVDKTNLGQSNIETQANAQNQGAYDAQKSQLIAQLGNDLGGIGQEELFKQYPEMMGMDYNETGQFIEKLKADKAKRKAARQLSRMT